MRPGALRAGALLALLAFAPLASAGTTYPARDLSQPATMGEGLRVLEAPLELGAGPEVVEVAHGLLWLRLSDGQAARAGTRVTDGVFVTRAARENAVRAFQARADRIRELEGEVSAMRAALSDADSRNVPALLPQPPPAPEAPGATPAPAMAKPSGAPWVVAAVLGGLALAFAGGVYVGARATGGGR